MSAPVATVVAPSGDAAKVTAMKGGVMLSTADVVTGGRRRKSRRMSKKAKKALKALKKMGGAEMEAAVEPEAEPMMEKEEGGRRHRSRKGSKKTRRSSRRSFLY
jgi:hypothetical protein